MTPVAMSTLIKTLSRPGLIDWNKPRRTSEDKSEALGNCLTLSNAYPVHHQCSVSRYPGRTSEH